MLFHVLLTTDCNFQCRYCFGQALADVDSDFGNFSVDCSLPKRIVYDVELLNNFCKKDANCVLIFYGGEPLLYADDLRSIMDRCMPSIS